MAKSPVRDGRIRSHAAPFSFVRDGTPTASSNNPTDESAGYFRSSRSSLAGLCADLVARYFGTWNSERGMKSIRGSRPRTISPPPRNSSTPAATTAATKNSPTPNAPSSVCSRRHATPSGLPGTPTAFCPPAQRCGHAATLGVDEGGITTRNGLRLGVATTPLALRICPNVHPR